MHHGHSLLAIKLYHTRLSSVSVLFLNVVFTELECRSVSGGRGISMEGLGLPAGASLDVLQGSVEWVLQRGPGSPMLH